MSVRNISALLAVCSLLFVSVPVHAATLSVSPSTGTMQLEKPFTVDIVVDTQGAVVDGVDINALTYDTEKLSVVDAYPSVEGVQIEAGTLMSSTMVNTVDTQEGKIRFSQVTGSDAIFTSTEPAVLATITFQPKERGVANLTFDYREGVTTDTNVAAVGSDVLKSVDNATYTIDGENQSYVTRFFNWVKGIFSN